MDKCYISGTVEINLNPKERKKIYLLINIKLWGFMLNLGVFEKYLEFIKKIF
ncbi:hypothetical protein [Clostridium sp.]|uniref:hypothetical protein n=1 Tax=Clostridium sp. TaxID=1506 RepID=UPI00263424FF